MHLSKLVKVLKSFDAPRLARLQKYAGSSYFAVYPPSVTLLNYLAPLHPQFAADKINAKAIGAENKNLTTASQQSIAGSRLMQAISCFLAQEEWQKSKGDVKRFELKGYREVQLKDEFDKAFAKEMQEMEKKGAQDVDFFSDKHLLTELLHNGFDARINRSTQNSIMPVVKTLDEFYAIKKLRYLCEALNRQQVLGIDIKYHDQHFPTLLHILQPYTNTRYPYVYLFVNVFRMMIAKSYEESEIPYRIIRQYAEEHTTPMPVAVIESIFYASSHCLRWSTTAYNEAGNEYLWWIAWRAKHNLLLDKGKLLPITFRNVMNIAVNNKKSSAWIAKFIRQYASHLPADYYESNHAFAQGIHQYTLKQYKKAIRFFRLAQAGDDVIFDCIIRRWEWIALYEYDPQDTDALLNHLSSFEKFLLRNKEGLKPVLNQFELFIDYCTKLTKEVPPSTLNLYNAQVQQEKQFVAKQWLIETFAAKSKTHKRSAKALS